MPSFIFPDSDGEVETPLHESVSDLMEKWSDAARKAAAAGRHARKSGQSSKAAARSAYKAAGGQRSDYAKARSAVAKAKKAVYRDRSGSEDYMGDRAHSAVSNAISHLSRASKTAKFKSNIARQHLAYLRGQKRGNDLKPGDHWALGYSLKGMRRSSMKAKKTGTPGSIYSRRYEKG